MSVMSILMIALMIVFYVAQTFFGKLYALSYRGPEHLATPVFAVLYGAIVGIATLIYNGMTYSPSPSTVILGIINGLILTLYNYATIKASASGPYSFQSMMTLFGNVLIVMAVSTLAWGDSLRIIQLCGVVLMLLGCVVFNLKAESNANPADGYYIWVAVLFISNGIYGSIMDCQQRLNASMYRNEMIITTFLVSAIFSGLPLLLMIKHENLRSVMPDKKAGGYVIISSIGAAAAVNMLMYALRFVETTVLFTILNGGLMIISALLSRLILKERLTRRQFIGLFIAAAGIMLAGM